MMQRPRRKQPTRDDRYTADEVLALLAKPKRGRIRNVAAKADRTRNGVVYDSRAEMMHAVKLDSMVHAGRICDWDRQINFPLEVNGVLICNFVVDFLVWDTATANPRYEEVKGWETPEYKLQVKLFRALYPDVDYRIVKA